MHVLLQKNRTLQSVNLSNNHIGDEGAKALGRALGKADRVEHEHV